MYHHEHIQPLMTKHKILNIANLYILRVCTGMHPSSTPKIHIMSPNRPEHDHHYPITSQIHNYPTRYSYNTTTTFITRSYEMSKTKNRV